jgi:hypothetical protein
MAVIAMNTNNPLGKRPFQQMGSYDFRDMDPGLNGDFDFPGAPIPWRRIAPEFLSGNAAKESALHPPAIIEELASPWGAVESTMMLGAAAVTSTQTVVHTTDTTPATTGVRASGQPVWSAWFSAQTIIPGLSNWEVGVGAIAAIALFKAMSGK